VIIAGTNEAATDAAAWKAAGKTENLWKNNFPLYGNLVFGRGPMNDAELDYCTERISAARSPPTRPRICSQRRADVVAAAAVARLAASAPLSSRISMSTRRPWR